MKQVGLLISSPEQGGTQRTQSRTHPDIGQNFKRLIQYVVSGAHLEAENC